MKLLLAYRQAPPNMAAPCPSCKQQVDRVILTEHGLSCISCAGIPNLFTPAPTGKLKESNHDDT